MGWPWRSKNFMKSKEWYRIAKCTAYDPCRALLALILAQKRISSFALSNLFILHARMNGVSPSKLVCSIGILEWSRRSRRIALSRLQVARWRALLPVSSCKSMGELADFVTRASEVRTRDPSATALKRFSVGESTAEAKMKIIIIVTKYRNVIIFCPELILIYFFKIPINACSSVYFAYIYKVTTCMKQKVNSLNLLILLSISDTSWKFLNSV